MLSRIVSGSVLGVDAYQVSVEVDMVNGMPSFHLVGLPEAAVRESKTRVMAAIRNCGIRMVEKRIIVNLAPADTRKDGTTFDLPIAIGVLHAGGILPDSAVHDYLLVGELSLGGEVLPIKGILPLTLLARELGLKGIIVPSDNAGEASVVQGIDVFKASTLGDVLDHFIASTPLALAAHDAAFPTHAANNECDLADVSGQEGAKRAIEVAAAGGHNLLFVGPPGSGKTMLARRLPTVLPPLEFEEAIETTKIYSVAGRIPNGIGLIRTRPFRSPHHTISDVALIGGGSVPKPGEISLAHRGVLFLDELPEFKKHVLEVLRQPLEEHVVHICRANMSITFPADVMLVAALNPCPCGFSTDPNHSCTCSPTQVALYRSRISGPLLDRIDIQVEVPALRYREMQLDAHHEASASVRERVCRAREIQRQRLRRDGVFCNAQMNKRNIKTHCEIDHKGHQLLEMVIDKLGMSARATDRILKVSRTIADLEGVEGIATHHLAEAIQYRSLDRGLQ